MDIGALVARSAARFPARIALDGPQGVQTFAQLGDRVNRLANALRGLGFQYGDRVLDLQPNQNSSVEMDLACCTAGLVRVVLNYRLHRDDWARIADDCGAVGLVYDGRYAEPCTALRDGYGSARTVSINGAAGDHDYETIIAAASPSAPAIDRAPDDLVSLNYTSGTTGRPKGVRRTHRNRWSSLIGMTFDVLGGVSRETDTYLHAGPITHTSGLFVLPFLAAGAKQLIHPAYDAAAVAEAVRHRGVTHTALVPTMIARLLALPDGEPLAGLKMLGYAGAPMPPEQIRQAYERLSANLVQYYGLVEAIPPVTVLDAADHRAGLTGDPALLTSAGRAALGVSLRMVDDDGKPVPANEVGEVVVRGDLVMGGYWGVEGGSVRAVVDGWLHTGDLGRLDDTGRLWLVDRKGDMIITGGYNIYPREVEDVIAEVPGVREVAVVGVTDPDWGQRVVALYTGSAVPADIERHCRARLASYKKPKEIRPVAEFPQNPTGKIAKNVLRRQLEEAP
jgi:acyl-CoA synthetase (AMP-forming)/AMP-acid ligase II